VDFDLFSIKRSHLFSDLFMGYAQAVCHDKFDVVYNSGSVIGDVSNLKLLPFLYI
jgi:hypothetical protein